MSPKLLLLCALLAVTAPAPAAETKPPLTPVQGRPPAPEMVLPDMDGKTHSLAEMRGKVVVVNFWATWCPPCREEMPSMQRVWELTREEGVVMLAVDVGETEETVFPFVAEHGIGFPILLDKDSAVTGRWPVLGLPTTFVIDPEGRMTYQAIGGRAWDSPPILEAIRGLRQPAEPKP